MNKNKISIAKKTLKLLERNSWTSITLSNIVSKKDQLFFKNKKELIINLNRYFDFLLKKNLTNLDQSSQKDMLFEILMARLDILNEYRNSIINLIRFFIKSSIFYQVNSFFC